ncbi:MAG: ribosome-associated translation inhibitor RaiA [Bacilli bacterium]
MKINIRGSKIKITDAMKEYVQNKVGKLDKYLDNPSEITANILVQVKGKDQTVEVTIPAKKFILRAEDTHTDFYAAVDLVSEKLERQVRKNKTRMNKKIDKKDLIFNINFETEKDEEDNRKIVKRKDIETKPMSEEEAILQMNLLGHSFFVFENENTNKINILYRRNDDDFGLIETK